MSQAITINQPLFMRKVEESADVTIYAFSGTPVDCAKIAFDHIFVNEKVDLVLSGINHGSNAAINVMYSGTMGAAIEGSFYGVPSIGLSLDDHDADANFEGAVEYGRRIISAVLAAADRLPRPLCLNVNVPRCAASDIQGIRLCRRHVASGARSSTTVRTLMVATTSGLREASTTLSLRLRIATSGHWHTAMLR